MKRLASILLLTALAFLRAPAEASAANGPAGEVVVPFTLALDLANLPSPSTLTDPGHTRLASEDDPLRIWYVPENLMYCHEPDAFTGCPAADTLILQISIANPSHDTFLEAVSLHVLAPDLAPIAGQEDAAPYLLEYRGPGAAATPSSREMGHMEPRRRRTAGLAISFQEALRRDDALPERITIRGEVRARPLRSTVRHEGDRVPVAPGEAAEVPATQLLPGVLVPADAALEPGSVTVATIDSPFLETALADKEGLVAATPVYRIRTRGLDPTVGIQAQLPQEQLRQLQADAPPGSDLCFLKFYVTGWSKEPFETPAEGLSYPLRLPHFSDLRGEPGDPLQHDWFVAAAVLHGAPDGATTCGWQAR